MRLKHIKINKEEVVMAKLNYDRDVKPLMREVDAKIDAKLSIRNVDTKWLLYMNQDNAYEGTLREVYCYLLGMQKMLEN